MIHQYKVVPGLILNLRMTWPNTLRTPDYKGPNIGNVAGLDKTVKCGSLDG